MPSTKNAQLRYQILDRCFSNFHHQYTIEELVDKVNDALGDISGTRVGLRQIRADITYMRDRLSFDAPIEAIKFDGNKCYYRYSEPGFSIYNNELSVEEVQKLRSTIDMLGRYRGGPNNGWLEEIISNLELRFGIKANRENIVSFEQNEQLRGLEFLSELIDAAINHQPILLTYRPYMGEEQQIVIHPHHLKQYNNRWFLFGVEDHAERGITPVTKALDRIISIVHAADKFIPSDIDYDKYFADIVGVTHDKNHLDVEDIILKFDPQRFPYVVSKPIHHSQRIIDEKNCILRLQIRPNRELEQTIFSFGPQVEVLEPAWLREQIMEKFITIVKIYGSVNKDCTDGALFCTRNSK